MNSNDRILKILLQTELQIQQDGSFVLNQNYFLDLKSINPRKKKNLKTVSFDTLDHELIDEPKKILKEFIEKTKLKKRNLSKTTFFYTNLIQNMRKKCEDNQN
jgi:hypothetical protein